jgi:hypothetical protein
MNFIFTAIDPTGITHRSTCQETFEKLLRDLRTQFPTDYIRIYADVQAEQFTNVKENKICE